MSEFLHGIWRFLRSACSNVCKWVINCLWTMWSYSTVLRNNWNFSLYCNSFWYWDGPLKDDSSYLMATHFVLIYLQTTIKETINKCVCKCLSLKSAVFWGVKPCTRVHITSDLTVSPLRMRSPTLITLCSRWGSDYIPRQFALKMNAGYTLPVLIGLTVTGISAAYLVYLLLRKVRTVVTGL
jgi:hypothetical protein